MSLSTEAEIAIVGIFISLLPTAAILVRCWLSRRRFRRRHRRSSSISDFQLEDDRQYRRWPNRDPARTCISSSPPPPPPPPPHHQSIALVNNITSWPSYPYPGMPCPQCATTARAVAVAAYQLDLRRNVTMGPKRFTDVALTV
ncbi:hypothetical protein MN608_11210 [Microdochium nivale]|nr:hypothetical protein MN608_11210 [Microdochium nivale]